MAPTAFKSGREIIITYVGGSVNGGQVTRRVAAKSFNERDLHTIDEDGDEITYRWDDLIDAKEVPVLDRIQPVILQALKDFRVGWADNQDGSAALVDFLTPPGSGSIKPGLHELDELADEIAFAVADHL